MAKEMMIVFVYDTMICQKEEDDPVSAVLYFHPSWVSDIQKLSLCGQLMGTTHFLRDSFFQPKIISLQSGKFVIKYFGRFILAVGTDRNISESILEYRANLLTSLLKVYHCDIQTIHDQLSINGQYKNLSEKLYHIFETYLPILQYNGSIFQNIPVLKLPKSASNIFLEAMQTLQGCQQTKGVLGGAILYHNKVVASQLSADLTKKLILTDPHRIKSTAESISVQFHVPVGVQLLIIYIKNSEYRKLLHESNRAQSTYNNNNNNTNILPFQIKRKLKRDKSLLFTHIPEEEAVTDINNCQTTIFNSNNINNNNNNSNKTRPTHLPLRFKNITTKDIPESGFSSINFDETDSFPDFIGKTSVVSTPMTENKILHGDILSICVNQNDVNVDDDILLKNTQQDITIKELNKIPNSDYSNYVLNPYRQIQRRNTLTDHHKTINKLSRRLTLRPFGIGLAKIKQPIVGYRNLDDVDDEFDDFDEINLKMCRTITDPTYPVFNSDGLPISKNLFQIFLEKYYDHLNEQTNIVDVNNKFDNFDLDIKVSPKHELKKNSPIKSIENEKTLTEIIQTPSSQTNRKSLTLPIKSLNLEPMTELNSKEKNSNDSVSQISSTTVSSSTNNMFDSPARRKKLSGLQLTPLMNKLTTLAMNDERSSGFSSWDTTPGIEIQQTPNTENKNFFKRRQSFKCDDILEETNTNGDGNGDQETLKKVELFVCGQQNMTLFLVLEEKACEKHDLIQSMWEICVSRLTKMETNLHHVLNLNMEGDKSEGAYSFILLDSKFDSVRTLQRFGPWSATDLLSLESMHTHFSLNPKFTDFLLRGDESVLYGYQCGQSEIFYQQTTNSKIGLPTPSDLLGTINLCARKRLERDHSIILL